MPYQYLKLSDVYLMFELFDEENGQYPEDRFQGKSMKDFFEENIYNGILSVENKE